MLFDSSTYEDFNKECLNLIEKLRESYYEEMFSINTIRDEQDNNVQLRSINFEYAPTSYSFLEYFFKKYPFNNNDHLIDFGCGKGRVIIMAAKHHCPILTGVEIDPIRYNNLTENIRSFKLHTNNESVFNTFNSDAKTLIIEYTVNKFFFFNPFHLKIYISIITSINSSLKLVPRDCWLILYRPQLSTIQYIDSIDTFYKVEQVNVDMNGEYVLFAVYSNKK